MPVTASNLETLLNLLAALSQRQETLRQLASQLQTGTIWRSPDGKLAVAMTAAQRDELAAFVKAYLDESDVIAATARAMLAQPAPKASPQ